MKLLGFLLFLIPVFACAAPININEADADTISEALSGIGPKKAEAIVEYRKEHGEFKSLDDLKNVSGIGEKIIQANEKDILFSGGSVEKPPKEKETEKTKPDTNKGAK